MSSSATHTENVPKDKHEAQAASSPARDVTQRFVYPDDRNMERPFDSRQLVRLLGFMRPYRRLGVTALLLTMLGTAANLATPYLLKLSLDMFDPTIRIMGHQQLRSQLIVYTGLLAACYLILFLSSRKRIVVTNLLGQYVLRDVRQTLYAHVQHLSFDFFDKRSAGSIMVRIINDVNSLQELFTNGVIQSLMDVFLLFGIAGIMFSMNVKLALAAMLVVPIMVVLSTKMRITVRRAWREVRKRSARINSHLNEAIQGMRVTQAFVQEEENQIFADHLNNDYRQTMIRTSKMADLLNPLITITGGLGVCLVYWYGASLYRQGEILLGTVYAFAAYQGRFWEPITRLGNLYNQLLQAMASSERIFEILDTQPTVTERVNVVILPQVQGKVVYDHVSFAYTAGKPTLQDVCLEVEPGQTIALVGQTGSGKTTFVNLLCRFYDVTGGRILIDGHDVRDVALPSLRSQIGVVLQDTYLFSGTIMENLRFGRLDATDEEVMAAAKAIGAHEFIQELPQGYQTQVSERGSGISLGQRQLLSFARAVLADPRILILDEATASIDTETEKQVQAALAKLLEGRTSFVVAHRLSTIRNADCILVMDHGRIVQKGTHDELMRQLGIYRDLVTAQYRFIA
ncbi:MAG: ABC transporter ATP-binding protein [Limnochordia bacterium]